MPNLLNSFLHLDRSMSTATTQLCELLSNRALLRQHPPKMPSATSPSSTHPDIPPFPSPQTFDILPDIYALISRLQLPSSNAGAASPTPTISSTSTSPLKPQNLNTAAVPIKQKIHKARAAVQTLPDVGRSMEEQEREIRALEARCEKLRGRVGELAALAGRKGAEGESGKDEVMEGIEGGS